MLDRTTTKARSILFGALRSKGHATVAAELGISESTFSEWLQKHSDRSCQLISALGMKIVPAENKCFPPDYVERLQYFAKLGIAQEPPSLDWPEEQN